MKIPQSGMDLGNPSFPLLAGLISYSGITDAPGAANGLTMVCGDLVNESSYDGHLLKIRGGPAAGQVKPIYVQAGNTLTFAIPWTNAAGAVQQIGASTPFDILSIVGGGGGPASAPPEGLCYYGVVDAVPGANQFTIGSLAGLGAGKFDGATNPYYAFVLRDAGGLGAAPQGEQLPVTAYATATGNFTTAAFTAAIAVGDEILLLHPAIASRVTDVDTQLDGILVQVPFYNDFLIDAGQTLTMFEFDALGATIREIFISFWLESDGGATFTLTWEKTSILAPVTWTVEVLPALANIVTPPADAYYSYKLRELAQGLQGRLRIAQAGGANDNVVDAWAVVLMVI